MRIIKNQQPKKLVLLVEDNGVMRKLLAGILQNSYRVQSFSSALEAINWLSKSKQTPDVVVSDIKMSEMGGIEFGQFLNINSLYGQVPLIYLSGTPEQELQSELNSVNYSGYTQKPFSPDKLLKTIASVA